MYITDGDSILALDMYEYSRIVVKVTKDNEAQMWKGNSPGCRDH